MLVSSTCEIAVADELAEAWSIALGSLSDVGSDCARIQLEADTAGARLTYTTREGSEAVRVLESPDELAPMIAALAERVLATPVLSEPSILSIEPAPATMPVFSLQAGARGGPNRASGFVMRGLIALSQGALEIGVAAEWDLRMTEASDDTASPSSAIALSIVAGMREPIGELALLAGAKLTLALNALDSASRPVLSINDPRRAMIVAEDQTTSEARFGLWAGAVWPRRESVRLRAELGADVVPRFGRGDQQMVPGVLRDPSEDSSLGARWAFACVLGVELTAP
jgi:hypothetical protein